MTSLLRKHPTAVAILFLILVVLVPHWKLTTMQGYMITNDIFTSDLMNDAFPMRHFLGEALKNGDPPTWYPYIYGGIPLIARAESGAVYPLNLLLFGLLSPWAALNVIILLTLITAGIGMFLLVRELDCSIPAAVMAGVSYAFCGFLIAHIKHLSNVNAACWFPLGLFFLERAFRCAREGNANAMARMFLWFGAVFGLQLLSGHVQTAYYAGVVYGFFFVLRFLHFRSSVPKRSSKANPVLPAPAALLVGWFAVATMIGVGVGAIQLLPTHEMVGYSQRAGGVTFGYASAYAYDPANFKMFFYPYANGDVGNGTYTADGIFWEDYGYAGLLPLLFAFYAAFRQWRLWHVKFFAILCLASYVMVLGPNTPVFEFMFNYFPGMKYFRFPTRFLFIVDTCIAVLGAVGLDDILKRAGGNRASRLGWVAVAVVVVDLVYFQMRHNPVIDADTWRTTPRTVSIIKQDSSLFRIYSPAAIETFKATFRLARGWQGDLTPYVYQREFIQPSLNTLYGLYSADGYAQLTPNHVVDVWGDQNRAGLIIVTAEVREGNFVPKAAFQKIVSMSNVKYLLSPWPVRSEVLRPLAKVGDVHLYLNPKVLPRAYVVTQYHTAESPEHAQKLLLSDSFNPAVEAIVYREPGFTSVAGAFQPAVKIERYTPTEVTLKVDTPRPGLLVLSDTYYPGWKAEVDGIETPIHLVNMCYRGVVVPEGARSVRFVFASTRVTVGLYISLFALAAFGAGMVVVGRQATKP